MLIRHTITIPAATTKYSPTITTVSIIPGKLRHVSVSFPPGCVGLVHVAVLYQEHQIIPGNVGEYMAWDGITIEWPEDIELVEVPHSLKVIGWNEDDTYQHRVTFRFTILGDASRKDETALRQILNVFGL